MDWNRIVTTLRERADAKWRNTKSPLSINREIGDAYADIADIIETEMRRAGCNAAVETQIEGYQSA